MIVIVFRIYSDFFERNKSDMRCLASCCIVSVTCEYVSAVIEMEACPIVPILSLGGHLPEATVSRAYVASREMKLLAIQVL